MMITILLALLVTVAPDLTSTTPIPRELDWWAARTAQLQEKVDRLGNDAKVIFVGDSITQGWEGNGAAIWQQTFAPCNAINLGIGGDRTEHVLWRMQNGNLRGLAPDVAVVMIGTNNFGQEESDSVAVVLDGVVAVVEQLKKSLPNVQVLLLDIFPRGKSFNAMRGSILQVNQALQVTFATDSRVSFFPIGHLFIEEDGSINPDIMPDYLHLSKQGYQIWADAITPQVLCEKVAD
jgi:lysophospholipase L1-like esterase